MNRRGAELMVKEGAYGRLGLEEGEILLRKGIL